MPFWDDHRGGNPLDALKREYNLVNVDRGIEYARRDIGRIYEFLQHAETRRRELLQQEYTAVIELRRHTNYSTKRVEYFVSVRREPVIDGTPSRAAAFYPDSTLSKHFTGSDRKAAIAYARELSTARGNCRIESDLAIPGGSS